MPETLIQYMAPLFAACDVARAMAKSWSVVVGGRLEPATSEACNALKCFLWPTFQISDGTTDPLPLALSGNNESFSDPAMTPFKHRHIKTLFKMSVG